MMKQMGQWHRRLRHPLHWIAGFVSSACLFLPDTTVAVFASLATMAAFGMYEWWQEKHIEDSGWKDWWEFIIAYYIGVVLLLILCFYKLI